MSGLSKLASAAATLAKPAAQTLGTVNVWGKRFTLPSAEVLRRAVRSSVIHQLRNGSEEMGVSAGHVLRGRLGVTLAAETRVVGYPLGGQVENFKTFALAVKPFSIKGTIVKDGLATPFERSGYLRMGPPDGGLHSRLDVYFGEVPPASPTKADYLRNFPNGAASWKPAPGRGGFGQ